MICRDGCARAPARSSWTVPMVSAFCAPRDCPKLIMDKIRECIATIYDLRSKINVHTGRTGEGVSCDEAGCVTQMADGAFVALALRPDALPDDCDRAALVVTARQASPSCPSPVLDLDRWRSQGPTALPRPRAGFAVEPVKQRGDHGAG